MSDTAPKRMTRYRLPPPSVSGVIAPGSIHRGIIADPLSPVAYGYAGRQLPVYFKGDLVLSVGKDPLAGFFGGGFLASVAFFRCSRFSLRPAGLIRLGST